MTPNCNNYTYNYNTTEKGVVKKAEGVSNQRECNIEHDASRDRPISSKHIEYCVNNSLFMLRKQLMTAVINVVFTFFLFTYI